MTATRGTRRSIDVRRARAARIVAGLRRLYPEAHCELTHTNALELLVATILSAQCTDERVNQVTPALFRKYRSAADWADADLAALEAEIRPTGFFRNKARSIVALGRALATRHRGEVPDSIDALVELPGVGRKTANVVLGTWFGRPAVMVDTHVSRLAGRMGLSDNDDPNKIELDLMALIPEDSWSFASHAMIWHGRRVCSARTPRCDACALRPDCPFPSASARPARTPGRRAGAT